MKCLDVEMKQDTDGDEVVPTIGADSGVARALALVLLWNLLVFVVLSMQIAAVANLSCFRSCFWCVIVLAHALVVGSRVFTFQFCCACSCARRVQASRVMT